MFYNSLILISQSCSKILLNAHQSTRRDPRRKIEEEYEHVSEASSGLGSASDAEEKTRGRRSNHQE